MINAPQSPTPLPKLRLMRMCIHKFSQPKGISLGTETLKVLVMVCHLILFNFMSVCICVMFVVGVCVCVRACVCACVYFTCVSLNIDIYIYMPYLLFEEDVYEPPFSHCTGLRTF